MGFRIDHLDGPRFDWINGRYYGSGAAGCHFGGRDYEAEEKRRLEKASKEKTGKKLQSDDVG